jgi:predicted NAD-dependent protein-ADP-ribosyltransferase YbiA (DUF1768 family)
VKAIVGLNTRIEEYMYTVYVEISEADSLCWCVGIHNMGRNSLGNRICVKVKVHLITGPRGGIEV